MSKRQLQTIAWGSSAIAAILAVAAWGQAYDWELGGLSTYQIFPLFGLLAFSLMWSHYITSAIRQLVNLDKEVVSTYFEATSLAVLVLILAHPGLLAWQLWSDGQGLPPGSELNYVPAGMRWAILLGMTAWLVFLVYELRRWFSGRSWWPLAQYASDGAMIFIFFHALRLGGQLQGGWFRTVWYFYGVTLAASLLYTYWLKTKRPRA